MEKEEIEAANLDKLVQRKQFIYRAYSYKNMSKYDFDKEIAEIEPRIRQLTREYLDSKHNELKQELQTFKSVITEDGPYKREIAKSLIKLLSPILSEEELKGVFRQGYKLMRGR